jgi:predicted patatin/cPLA2 family phospholipase
MKALVISGGAAKGAYAGGFAQYLIEEAGRQYDVFIGSSTGSLLITHLALGEIDKLKRVYTSVTQHDIFDVSPFIVEEKDGRLVSRINHWNILWQFIKRKKTFGESRALKNLLRKTLTEEEFNRAQALPVKLAVTVSNLTLNKVEYKYLSDYAYDDFLDWVWYSCNLVPFMSLESKYGYEYGDGGFGNLIPVQEAVANGATEIDVIVLSPRHWARHKEDSHNAFDVLLNAFDFMLDQIRQDDLFIGHMESIYNDIQVRFHHTPYLLTDNSFIFDPIKMAEWWDLGFETAKRKLSVQP